MRKLYEEMSANYPRLKTDVNFADYTNTYKYSGFIDEAMLYIEDFQLLSPERWRRFVQQFREDADFDAGWKGEYWGKMMRGACLVYSYTKSKSLYDTLATTINDMIESADETGRISSYGINHEFDGWDIWSRKYVLLGMQYFIEICEDSDFIAKIIKSMKAQLDYIISKIGNKEDGKKPITAATRHWRGLNSCSLLEPVVRLYNLTKEEKYFKFAEYIVSHGGTDVINLFDLAYENNFSPYQYPVTKAYEMTSCFEGLLEFYRITGIERYKTALINFANKVIETDFTVIGSSGCTHELFDHSTVRQTNTTNGKIVQETCVTVTLMKFFYQMHLLTGNPSYADAFEISLYNAYLGSINTEKVIEPSIRAAHPDWNLEPLPFDSYSPLTAGTRANGVGGLQIMSDNHYYGCCACIGAAGIGLVPKMQLLSKENGFTMNLFINGRVETTSPAGNKVIFETITNYPTDGDVKINITTEVEEEFEVKIRNPYWNKQTAISVNGGKLSTLDGYYSILDKWSGTKTIEYSLDMRCEAIFPIPYEPELLMNHVIWGVNLMIPTYDKQDPLAMKHIALRRGPVMLAQENRLGYSVDEPIEVAVNENGYVDATVPEKDIAPYKHIVEMQIPLKDGSKMTVTDYSSAGKTWTEESKMAVWMLTK